MERLASPGMARHRHHSRANSASSSSSSSTSPEDNDSLDMGLGNDSQSSLGLDAAPELSQDDALRRAWEERCRVSPVARLPAELLISIFSRLDRTRDLLSCILVSKEWARNSVGLLWHRPAMGKWESIHSVVRSIRKSGSKFFAYQDLVKRLNMSALAGSVSDGTLRGMKECKRIERLTLTKCSKLSDDSLEPLIDGNRSLLALDVTDLEQLTDRTMMTVADNCLRLQGLNVTGCKRLTDASIVALARNCRHLKRLKFNNCVQLTDVAIQTVADNSSHLLEIDLYGLTHLESPAVTALLTSCPQLREVRLAQCPRITDLAFLNIPFNPDKPCQFESLRILDLTSCVELGDKGVERIIQTCPRLRNLILAKCRNITDRAVFAIARLGKNLHYIHLGHCVQITDLSVEALAKACNRIRYIDLACCSNLTDASVEKLAGLPKLKRIGLVKCATITNRSIYSLAVGGSKNGRHAGGHSVLERVHLSYCTELTVEGIHFLLQNCPKLTHLSLTGVTAFLQDDILAFCREAPQEFNDHQRQLFCVFSGDGVSRLREYFNQQKAAATAAADNASGGGGGLSSTDGDDEDGALDGSVRIDLNTLLNPTPTDSGGSATPVINVNVHSNFPHGSTPVLAGPSTPAASTSTAQHQHQHQYHALPPPSPPMLSVLSYHSHFPALASPSVQRPHPLSQSAPATTGGAVWAGGATPVLLHHATHATGGGGGGGGGAAGTQHVTGMMSAAILDDQDVEGDGTGSEMFDDGDESFMQNGE